jgi:octaprenyl-diphosphate synthase
MIVRSGRTAGRPALGGGGLFVQLQPHLRALDRFLRSQLGGFEPEIRGPVEYCLDISGKRLRPALVFVSGWSGARVAPRLVRAAAIVEMVHLATLVHDDIIDGAQLRRSRPTAARRFGSDAAVLTGDALLAHAVHLAAQYPSAEVCRVVAAATRRVCAGEVAQTLRRGDTSITLADYRRIIDLKTAELFQLSCRLGSSLAGFDGAYVEAASAFGRRLGIAYQIYDDLADFYGEEERIGKTLGTDLAGGKLTLPLLMLLPRLPRPERARLLAEIRDGRKPAARRRRAQMTDLGVFAEVAGQIQAELRAAVAVLRPWSRREPARLLGRLAELLREQVEGLQRGAIA